MHFLPAMLIQVGLLFLPFVLMLVAKASFPGRPMRLFFAATIALGAGWCASHAASDLGWQPVLKGGHMAGLSPSALFWAFAGAHFVTLLLFALPKDKLSIHITPPAGSGKTRSDGAGSWRVGHTGRDLMFYEEFHEGAWRRIEISGEMLMGPAHHVIYFASPTEWERYPEWARGRRDELVARIKSTFRPPDYEYHGG